MQQESRELQSPASRNRGPRFSSQSARAAGKNVYKEHAVSERGFWAKQESAMAEKQEKVYGPEEIQAKIRESGLVDWYLEDGWLRRKYNTDGWPTTLMLTNAIGYLCEAAWHHADLAITWGKVWVKLKTHSAGGITDKDF